MLYIFKNPDKEEYVEVWQGINEEHIYQKDGINFERIYTVPNAQIKENWDVNSSQDFAYKTKHSKGSCGDLFDRAKELSDKRAKNSSDGTDPVLRQKQNDWTITRKGKKMPGDNRTPNQISKDIKKNKNNEKN